jgi:toxin ParE1/3/4
MQGFRKYLIFYFDRDDGMEVVRILYATQHISSILDDDV